MAELRTPAAGGLEAMRLGRGKQLSLEVTGRTGDGPEGVPGISGDDPAVRLADAAHHELERLLDMLVPVRPIVGAGVFVIFVSDTKLIQVGVELAV